MRGAGSGSPPAVLLLIGVALALGGCSPIPAGGVRPSPPPQAQFPPAAPAPAGRSRVVAVAERMLGTPYRYGGDSPRGFDCSGLVHYAYSRAGYRVPRTARGQYQDTRPVSLRNARPGDILFFRIEGKPSHVGLYVGGGRFIHAPSSGERVHYSSLHNHYWRERLVKVGRF